MEFWITVAAAIGVVWVFVGAIVAVVVGKTVAAAEQDRQFAALKRVQDGELPAVTPVATDTSRLSTHPHS